MGISKNYKLREREKFDFYGFWRLRDISKFDYKKVRHSCHV